MKRYLTWILFASGAILAGCGTHGLDGVPSFQQANLSSIGKLQLAVGTAQLADGTIGVNVVTTFRQASGASAVLVDSPTFTGPTTFLIPSPAPSPACQKSSNCQTNGFFPEGDAGTNTITSEQQNPNPYNTPAPGKQPSLGQSGGIFASGFAPDNSGIGGAYSMPLFNIVAPQTYYVGPPAVPYFKDGTFPGFTGYLTGFTALEAPAVAGSYTLSVFIGAANAAPATYSQTASLNNLNPLPAVSTPAFTEDGTGGGTATVNVGSDPRTVETLLYVFNRSQGNFYTVGPVKGNGTLTFTVPDKIGNCSIVSTGCENGPNAGPSLASGDAYFVYAASFDYAQFEAEPPGNMTQTPTITGPAGQADVSLSPASAIANY